ncbi:HPr family phosphocarrier protein [Microbacterium pseudoresistens]|uniref:Phosphotransferase system HPr (HPr) family protein n=1 Tax=Microbacterium pseudoresistens TaxID=640634 RepID=A0A7Y9EVR2_9MICO|nr:HPr family phosphocarrier protein [Microbacterium pseudoresistens]NYD54854.1 phosphotransferase system HPr (HPr) family protein [Microbacterium pseudoresistens]
MPRRTVTIHAADGMHARPVAELVRLTTAYGAPVTLTTADGVEVELASILAVMELALGQGDEVVLSTADSPRAETLLDALTAVLSAPDAP